jgi:hypothetical protein
VASENFLNGIIQRKGLSCRAIRQHFLEYRSDEPYDAIVNFGVTEHLPDYRRTVEKLCTPAETWPPRLPGLLFRERHGMPSFITKWVYEGNTSPLCFEKYTAALARTPLEIIEVQNDRRNYFLTCKKWAEKSGSPTRRHCGPLGQHSVPALPALSLGGGKTPSTSARYLLIIWSLNYPIPCGQNDAAAAVRDLRRLDTRSSIPFFVIHAAGLLAIWTGVSWPAVVVCLLTYFVRMFGITAGFHRYFSHRSFKTGRVFQFTLAWLGTASIQKGVLWWAAHHRHHHAHSDTERDTHSPVTGGFWWSHVGWFLCNEFDETQCHLIPDLMRFPELRWLNRWYVAPPISLAALCSCWGRC